MGRRKVFCGPLIERVFGRDSDSHGSGRTRPYLWGLSTGGVRGLCSRHVIRVRRAKVFLPWHRQPTTWQADAATHLTKCLLRAKERSQHSITQAARDSETAESIGSNRTTGAKWIRTARVARHDEIACQRLPTSRERVATTGDRTQKGRRLWTPAFRITLR